MQRPDATAVAGFNAWKNKFQRHVKKGEKSLPELKASLETIGKTANQLITDIDRHFKEICKEQGIDLTRPEQDATEVEAPVPPVEVQPEQTPVEPPQPVPLEMVNTLREAAEQVLQDAIAEIEEQYPDPLEKLRDHISAEDDALWDTVLDEYPMPDPAFLPDELEQSYRYMDGDLLPLSKERAAELLERDLTIYAIVDGGQAEMVFDRDDLEERPPDMVFAVSKEEWEVSQDFREAVADRMDHQGEREKAFLEHGGDCFAIYQVKGGEGQRDLRFMDMNWLTSKGLTVDRANYDLVYTGELAFGQDQSVLEKLYKRFNIDHPADYHRPSMSVSDIVAIKQNDVVSFHYCDSIGFVEVPDFIKKEPTVAQLEQQARSGQPISLMALAAATHREEQEQKQSVVKKLKNQPKREQKRTAPKRSAERNR